MALSTPCHKSWVWASDVHACVQLCPTLPSLCMDTQETIGTFPKGCRKILVQLVHLGRQMDSDVRN